MSGQIAHRIEPELIFRLVAKSEAEAHLINGITAANQRLNLDHGHAIIVIGAEGDHPRKHMPLWRHEGERFIVSVDNAHAGGQLHTAGNGQVEHSHFARLDALQRTIEVVTVGPKFGEMRFPFLDNRLWRDTNTNHAGK